MKKLLTLLCSLLTTTTLGTDVVSCSKANKYDQHDSDGNGYFYYYPQGENGGEYFSTSNAWDKWGLNESLLEDNPKLENNLPVNIRENIVQNIMKMFNVSAMDHISDGSDKVDNNISKSAAQFSDFKSMFNDQWSLLKNEVNNTIADKKSAEGKNWDKWLKDNYSGDEKKYSAFLYQQGDGTQSASSMASDLLVNNYQSDYDYDASVPISTLLNWINTNDSNANWQYIAYATLGLTLDQDEANTNFKTAFENDINGKKYFNIINTISSYGSNLKYLSISKYSDSSTNSNYISPKIDDKGNFKINYNDIDTNNLNGMLSPTQEFIESNWFQNEHPLAVSQILVKYDNTNGTTFDITKNQLKDKKMNDLFSSDTIQNVKSLIPTGLNGTNWSNLTNSIADLNDTNITSTYESSLLTANVAASDTDGFANDDFKNAVYNSILGYTNSDDTSKKEVVTSTDNIESLNSLSDLSTDTLVPSYLQKNNTVNYDSSSKILVSNDEFKIFNLDTNNKDVDNNVIIYFDNLGLHIVHIDGINNLVPTSALAYNNSKLGEYTRSDQNTKIRDYFNYMNKASGDSALPNFNNETSSKYLDWLNNNSYSINAKNANIKQLYTYDLLSELKTYATFDATSDSVNPQSQGMWFWEYDLIKWYETDGLQDQDGLNNWLSKFLTIPTDGDITSENINFIFKQQLESYAKNLDSLYQTNLTTNLNNIKNNINSNKLGPQGYIDIAKYNDNDNSGFAQNIDLWNTWDFTK